VGMELNRTQQLLAYNDNVTTIGGKINTINKNTKTPR
jgi:hypothetical protein